MASKRVIIVGGVAGGATCAARLRRLDESAEIFMYERGSHVSFANCGLPYYLGGVIADRKKLLVATPEQFRDIFSIEVRTGREVTSINREAKTVEVVNLFTGAVSTEPYDALVLAPGASPVRPPIEGIDLPGILSVRTLDDADQVNQWIEHCNAQRAVVVGAGYIGLEMVENLTRRGIDVTVLERLDQIMATMDAEMVTPVYSVLTREGVDLHLSNGVDHFESAADGSLMVIAEQRQRFPADLVILSVGVKPEIKLAQESGLEIGEAGGIRVDERMRTSDPSIWAVGDAVEVKDVITGQMKLIPLAGPANRQARIAADVICGRDSTYRGTQGSAVVGLFDLTLAMTGASEKTLQGAEIPYAKSYTHSPNHASYYPGAKTLSIKLLYAPDTGRLLGAQAVGGPGVDKRIDVIAMAIQKEATIYDLEEAELCYAPQFGNSKDPVNMAGFVAGNRLRGDVDVVHWEDWQDRTTGGDDSLTVIDVRPSSVVAKKGEVPGTVNIPLGELRSRMAELPRDGEIWVHCIVGQHSYYACRILAHHGFRVRNLSGGMTSYGLMVGD
jgi:NADPH-dependent 2,4-dienoyl-CoA reductase/sulfur reductase-like enzyme/rhodanese-related sulfurtransferase